MSFASLRQLAENKATEWGGVRLADLEFWHRPEARLGLIGLVGLSVVLLVTRSAIRRRPGRHRLVMPAILSSMRSSSFSFVRHLPLMLFFVGLPFFVVALSDPYISLVTSTVTYPGRRIAVMIDASTSMRMPFKTTTLKAKVARDATFFTTVAAAEIFVRHRMDGRYRDLVSLIEFGNDAYVITPFTHDYDNLLLSISLIGDPAEFSLFPDEGTIVANAIDQSIGLFKAFNFLDASGNLMVVFTDGEDTQTIIGDKTLDEIMQASIDAQIPVYFVRTNYELGKGKVIPDALWEPAVLKTGGRFYVADTEEHLLAAIKEIDEVSAGTIQTQQYSVQNPRFSLFAFVAAALWTMAAGAKLLLPQFQKLP